MIVRVWGTINQKEVEFQPIADKPGYYEGYGPRSELYQNIEIWAKNDLGAIGHLKCTVFVKEWTETYVKLIIAPYNVRMIPHEEIYERRLLNDRKSNYENW